MLLTPENSRKNTKIEKESFEKHKNTKIEINNTYLRNEGMNMDLKKPREWLINEP